jgi:DICT domain-containing protein
MSQEVPDSLREFLDSGDASERSLVVVNREGPEPFRRLFEETFERVPVDVEERTIPAETDDVVLLVEDGEVVATSPLERLRDAVLLVNADLYRTGLSGIEKHEAPDVLTALDETTFTLRGFPASNKEKLLLVVMSRHIERLALEAGTGRLDTAFQQLSRIRDEYGTRTVYDRLAGSDVDIHVYGVPDADPGIDGVTVHGGESRRYRRSWFVAFDPPAGAATDPAALVALESESNVWEATWTYDRRRVERIRRHVVEHF